MGTQSGGQAEDVLMPSTPSVSNDANGDNSQSESRKRLYASNYSGPFVVFIRELLENKVVLKTLALSKHLYSTYKSIKYIKPNGKAKLKIEFGSLLEANAMCVDPELKLFYVYIPAIEVEIQGSIALSCTEDANEILSHGYGKFKNPRISEKVPILEVHRNQKYSESDPDTLIPLNSVRITFQGKVLPDYVVLYNLLLPVRLYIPKPKMCMNCLSFGHTDKFCSKLPSCSVCLKEHNTKDCTNTVANSLPIIPCKHCNSNEHLTGFKDCPSRNILFERKKIGLNQKQQFSYASVLASLGEEMPGESDSSFPVLNNTNAFGKKSKFKNRASFNAKTDKDEESAPKKRRFYDTSTKEAHKSQIPPGFNKLSDEDSIVKNMILNFCKECQLPTIVIKLIESILIPILLKVWNKINALFTSLPFGVSGE